MKKGNPLDRHASRTDAPARFHGTRVPPPRLVIPPSFLYLCPPKRVQYPRLRCVTP